MVLLGALRQREDGEKGVGLPPVKSEIIPIGGVEEVDRATAVFGCKVGNLPTNYLGLPLGASHKSCKVWDGESETQIGKNSKGVLVGRYGGKKEDSLGRVFGEESLLANLGRCKVGGHLRTNQIWWDMWVGDSKLKDLLPLLFRIAANNSAIVDDLWGRQEVRVQEGEDFLVWKIERKGTLRYANEEGLSMANRCNLCKANEETANHILIHCGKTRDLGICCFLRLGWCGCSGFREKFAS
ncbi:hypothetical protein CK203_024723 [Vitis vinifera]|uniref:Reverse transcriptase zinc-binding domain-containing protein n=1 Tax=Vitis vinifera TaxID=29760 RepID=A0A438ITE5_VITVI|nr:hypothetical protein CK203_024723 [Vitis vinifera]